jgi:uncharacterized protein
MRVVLDTNVIVAGMAYPNGPPGRVVQAWRSGALEVFLSPWILAECARVLPRLRPFTQMTDAEIAELVEQLAFAADVRDAADEPVLATLLATGADLLITGDKDLLVLAHRYAILSPAAFCARHVP